MSTSSNEPKTFPADPAATASRELSGFTEGKEKFKLPEHLILIAGPSVSDITREDPTTGHPTELVVPPTEMAPADPTHPSGSEAVATNASFIAEVFRIVPAGAQVAVCSKEGDPSLGGWWARRADQTGDTLSSTTNNYVAGSSFHPDSDGTIKVRKDRVAACHFLMLDDLGSKVPIERLNGFPLSWVIETSPGNFQGGIILDPPVTDVALVTEVHKAIIDAGLCDPGATGPSNRWARLPVAINGKPKHVDADGAPFHCRLVEWRPEARYTLQQVVDGLGLVPRANEPSATADRVPSGQRGTIEGRAVSAQSQPPELRHARLGVLLDHIDPNCSYDSWFSALAAVAYETGGSESGFELVNDWSARGGTYPGRAELLSKWGSLKAEGDGTFTIDRLFYLVRQGGHDLNEVLLLAEPDFEPCDTETLVPGSDATVAPSATPSGRTHAFAPFSLLGRAGELESRMVKQVAILGDIALLGQATVIYALANTGKTLIVLHLLIEAIKKGLFDPANLVYINMDDNSQGLVEKAKLADEYGFHMVADGYQGFEAKSYGEAMSEMVEGDRARGTIVVLDTLKKFVNIMDKTKASSFARLVRQFVLKGGTLIALAHANKNRGMDGKVVYGGTTDIVDDFDCAFTVEAMPQQCDARVRLVEFTNIKNRGNVALTAAYEYALERQVSYADLLLSVREINPNQLVPIRQAAEAESDAELIQAITGCIRDGVTSKMKLADAAADRAKSAKRRALTVIEKYTGEDPVQHRWSFKVVERGAKVFALLPPQDGSAAQ